MTGPMKSFERLAAPLLAALAALTVAAAADDPTRRATRLPTLSIAAGSGFSVRSYEIESGTYYRWRIESDGLEEYKLLAPELFRESWIDQIVIDGLEVKPHGLHAVEFDEEGFLLSLVADGLKLEGGVTLQVYSNDHPPPHVHVLVRSQPRLKLRIRLDNGEPMDDPGSVRAKELRRFSELVVEHNKLLTAWWMKKSAA